MKVIPTPLSSTGTYEIENDKPATIRRTSALARHISDLKAIKQIRREINHELPLETTGRTSLVGRRSVNTLSHKTTFSGRNIVQVS